MKLVNTSLEQGAFHSSWKLEILRPLIKKLSGKLERTNYGPVSNLSFISKIIEKAAMSQILDYCNNLQLMPDYQSAYRPNHSCKTSLIKISNDILWSIVHQKLTLLICMDLSAAFDTVDHDILLGLLHNKFGIAGIVLKWCEDYLRDRRMQVCVGEEYSNERVFNYLVPQGSCNGPVFFHSICQYSRKSYI